MALNELISNLNENKPDNGWSTGNVEVTGDISGGVIDGPLVSFAPFPPETGFVPTTPQYPLVNCLQNSKYDQMFAGDEYNVYRINELRDCPGSPAFAISICSYVNSFLSLIGFIVSTIILCRKLGFKSFKYSFMLPYFYMYLTLEALYNVTRNIEQKTAFPIMDMKIWDGVTWHGWYTGYGKTMAFVLEQAIRSIIDAQTVTLLFLSIGIIVNSYNSKRVKLVYFLGIIVFTAMQVFSIYMRLNQIMLYSFVPVIFAQLSCAITLFLYRFITQTIFFKMDLVDAERQRELSFYSAVAVWLNWAIVSPKGVAWCVIIATYWFINGKVSFHTTLYEGYLVLAVTEMSKWFSTVKILFFWYTIKK